jgi:hypothetical protein
MEWLMLPVNSHLFLAELLLQISPRFTPSRSDYSDPEKKGHSSYRSVKDDEIRAIPLFNLTFCNLLLINYNKGHFQRTNENPMRNVTFCFRPKSGVLQFACIYIKCVGGLSTFPHLTLTLITYYIFFHYRNHPMTASKALADSCLRTSGGNIIILRRKRACVPYECNKVEKDTNG